MPANLSDLYAAYTTRETAVVEAAFRPERRRRARTKVHWTLLLRCDRGVDAVESVTQNLSSSGFYFLSPKPLVPGESLVCALKVPAYDPEGEERTVALECRVQVIRAEAALDGLFGMACQIEDYHLIRVGT